MLLWLVHANITDPEEKFKIIYQVLQKIKIELLYNSEIPTLGYMSKRTESVVTKRYLYIHIHSSVIRNSEMVEAS